MRQKKLWRTKFCDDFCYPVVSIWYVVVEWMGGLCRLFHAGGRLEISREPYLASSILTRLTLVIYFMEYVLYYLKKEISYKLQYIQRVKWLFSTLKCWREKLIWSLDLDFRVFFLEWKYFHSFHSCKMTAISTSLLSSKFQYRK